MNRLTRIYGKIGVAALIGLTYIEASQGFVDSNIQKLAVQIKDLPESGDFILDEEIGYKSALQNYFELQNLALASGKLANKDKLGSDPNTIKNAQKIYSEISNNYKKISDYLRTMEKMHREKIGGLPRVIKASALAELYEMSFHDYHYNVLRNLFEVKEACQIKKDSNGSLCASGDMFDLDAIAKGFWRKILNLKYEQLAIHTPMAKKISSVKRALYEKYSDEFGSGLLPEYGLTAKMGSSDGKVIFVTSTPISLRTIGNRLWESSNSKFQLAIGYDGNYWRAILNLVGKPAVEPANEMVLVDEWLKKSCEDLINESKKREENRIDKDCQNASHILCGPMKKIKWPSYDSQVSDDEFRAMQEQVNVAVYCVN